MGRLVHLRLPRPLARRLVRWFAGYYEIDVDAAERPLHEYPSIGHFFVRDLREGLRPIEGELVSPVDGLLRNFGVVRNGRLEQVKGKSYTLQRFLSDETDAARYENGFFFNFYLAPQDYHHVHAPVGGAIRRSVHIPGKLWPVNDWSLANIDELFSINERVVTCIDSALGRVAVVMIGALNVGKISVVYDSFISNVSGTKAPATRDYDPPLPIAAGDRLGTFHMGSSVVILLEPARIPPDRIAVLPQTKLRYGQKLVSGL